MDKIIKSKPLDYNLYQHYIKKLKKEYESLKTATCGKSALGKEIYALVLGKGKKKVCYVGGTHGLEWMTSLCLLRFCENLLSKEEISGYKIDTLLENCTLIIIPELNPDGIEISQKGSMACEFRESENIKICNNDFSSWSANANGVDINHNFNADWYSLRDFEEKNNIRSPSPRRFGGYFPESEPETKAITRLLRNISVETLVSFHSQGEEIFYEYGEQISEKSLLMAKAFSSVTDYTLVKNEGHYSSGGLKDWFIEEFHKPGFTIEIGKGKNPLPLADFDNIYKKIEPLLILGMIL